MSRLLRYPRPAKLTELTHYNHAVIEASAGTGKTYTMEHLVVDLLLETDARLEEILVVTFTERATGELKKRIRGVLETIVGAWDRGPDSADVPDPAQPCWEIDDEGYRKLRRALFSFDVAPIYTIHGFCQRVLTEHAFANHRLFDEEHVDADRLFDHVFAETLRRDFACDPALVPYLEAWMEAVPGPLEALRGLLSGCVGTTAELRPRFDPDALVERLARYDAEPLDALEERLVAALAAVKMNASRRRALGDRVKNLLAALGDYRTDRSLPRLLARCETLKLEYVREHQDEFVQCGPEAAALVELVEELVPLRAAVAVQFTARMRQRLREEKDRAGVFSYDDMLTMVWESLERGGAGELVELLRARYKYGLIDEFQDTDPVQWRIFRRIFFESNRRNILYIIGDPKQAIYGFRGADVFTYLEARREVREAGGSVLHLEENYRSTRDVIDGYNHLFDQHGELGPFFTGEIDYSRPVRCGRPGLELVDKRGVTEKPFQILQLVPAPGERLDADAVRHGFARLYAAEIRRLLTDGLVMRDQDALGPDGSPERGRPIVPRDIYVLTHKRKDGLVVAQHLREAGVPFAFYKQDGLFQTSEARDIYELLCAVDEVFDRAKRLQAWMTPFFEVPLAALPALDALPETHPLFARLLGWHALARARRFEELFASILDHSGLIRREVFFNESERELTNYVHIFELLLEEAGRQRLDAGELCMRLKAFIDGTASPPGAGSDGDVQRLESERDAVQIMTMHKSKGLEADVVFVYGGFSGFQGGDLHTFHDAHGQPVVHVGRPDPADYERVVQERDEEEHRLLYVTLTRARGRVYLPYVEEEDFARKPTGCYRHLNARLAPLATRLRAGFANPLFALHLHVDAPQPAPRNSPEAAAALARWQPPARLRADSRAELAALSEALESHHARRLVVSSYSRMKGKDGGYTNHLETDVFGTGGRPAALLALGDDALPGGVASGHFLHLVVEHLDFDRVLDHRNLQSFEADADIEALFREQMRQHGIDARYLRYCQRVVYHTLTSEVRVAAPDPAPPVVIDRLAACRPHLFELEFTFPIPEGHHPRLDGVPGDRLTIERGFIRGFIDFVFEHRGRLYFADWKSDILERYDAPTLAAHIADNYDIQARLYSIAMVKMLGIRDAADYEARFGGFFYFFMRGMGHGDGVHYQRLPWSELLAYEQALVEREVY